MYRATWPGSLLRRGLARGDLGDAPGAAADARWRWACTKGCRRGRASNGSQTACCHAALCGLSGHDGAAVSAAEGEQAAARAIGALTRAAALGFRDAHQWRTESALDPLLLRATTSGS